MNVSEMEELLRDETFTPFVLTTNDGFSLPIASPRQTLVGIGMLVVKYEGRLYHVPLGAISHIVHPGEHL